MREYKKYKDKRTGRLVSGDRVPVFEGFREQAEKRLTILDAATDIAHLRQLPSNRLEALRGDRKGQYSIRINAQWRVCFEWSEELRIAYHIEIVDYH